MNTQFKIPFYARASVIFIGMLAFVTVLYVSQGILVPLVCATIIAIVLSPVVDFFVKRRINRLISITIVILILLVLSAGIITLLSTQLSLFSDSFPKLVSKFDQLLHQTEGWVSSNFHISANRINSWIDETNSDILNSSRAMLGQALINIGGLLIVLVLVPVYVFMILFYKPLLVEFVYLLFSADKSSAINEVLTATKKIIQSYLVGLLLEAAIMTVLYSACLLILGVDYAILLGVIGAIVNVIPYIGGVIAAVLPMLIALATKTPSYAVLILALYIVIQFVDNHYIKPGVVASKVHINALVSVVVVLAGSALWGITGMFLSIPLTAILKVVFDHIDGLKPWGYVLGNGRHKGGIMKI